MARIPGRVLAGGINYGHVGSLKPKHIILFIAAGMGDQRGRHRPGHSATRTSASGAELRGGAHERRALNSRAAHTERVAVKSTAKTQRRLVSNSLTG
jgi:hypothetical protein